MIVDDTIRVVMGQIIFRDMNQILVSVSMSVYKDLPGLKDTITSKSAVSTRVC